MKKFSLALLFALAFAAGCDNAKTADGEAAPAEAAAEQPVAEQQAALVEVSVEGTPFEPAVEKAQIPEGSWICDMGTVHYARSEQGDGTCPLCNMKLVQYGAAAEDGAEAEAEAGGTGGGPIAAGGEGCGCEDCNHAEGGEGCAGCEKCAGKADGCAEGCSGCEKCQGKAEGCAEGCTGCEKCQGGGEHAHAE